MPPCLWIRWGRELLATSIRLSVSRTLHTHIGYRRWAEWGERKNCLGNPDKDFRTGAQYVTLRVPTWGSSPQSFQSHHYNRVFSPCSSAGVPLGVQRLWAKGGDACGRHGFRRTALCRLGCERHAERGVFLYAESGRRVLGNEKSAAAEIVVMLSETIRGAGLALRHPFILLGYHYDSENGYSRIELEHGIIVA